jgi:hypothetical protein
VAQEREIREIHDENERSGDPLGALLALMGIGNLEGTCSPGRDPLVAAKSRAEYLRPPWSGAALSPPAPARIGKRTSAPSHGEMT